MLNIFKLFAPCEHPFDALVTEKEQTVEKASEDFEHITYHFVCFLCDKKLTIKHARTIGGVDGIMSRERLRQATQPRLTPGINLTQGIE